MSDVQDPGFRRRRRILGAVFGVAVGVLAVLLVVTAITSLSTLSAIRETQKEGVQRSQDTLAIAKEVRRVANRIDECTTPNRPCTNRGQKQTAKAVGSIVTQGKKSDRQSSSAAAWCAMSLHTYEEIYACVTKKLGR